MAAQTGGETQGQGDFQQIGQDIGEHTPPEGGPQSHRLTAHGIDDHKPDGAESIAHQQSQRHTQPQHPQLGSQQPFHAPHQQRGE